MNSIIIFVLLFLVLAGASDAAAAEQQPDPAFTSVWFSCNKQTSNQSFWTNVISPQVQGREIDVLSGVGDNGYFDQIAPFWPLRRQATPRDIQQGFNMLFADAHFSAFLSKVKRLAGWVRDDHELKNDGDKNDLYREELQHLFLDALQLPRTEKQQLNASLPAALERSPMHRFAQHYNQKEIDVRRNKRVGLYSFEKIPIAGSKDAAVCYINLDVRTHRDAPGEGEDILGPVQWAWLERVMETGRDSEVEDEADLDCVVRFLSSGVQIIGDAMPTEGWQQHPQSRNRLLQIIAKNNPGNSVKKIVLLSGDVHLGEVHKIGADDKYPFDLFEVTSSGMTHSAESLTPISSMKILTPAIYGTIFPSRRRIGGAFLGKNFGIIRVYAPSSSSSSLSSKSTFWQVVITIHSIETGEEVIRVEPTFAAPTASQPSSLDQQFDLEILHAPLTRAILGLHHAIAPSAPRYLTILSAIIVALVALVIFVVGTLRWIKRALSSSTAKNTKQKPE